MVNGNKRLPDGWKQATVGDIATSMKNGIYKPAEFYADDGIACLRMYNIEGCTIVWKDIKRMKLTEDEIGTYRLLPGDILINRVNSRELVGKAAVIPEGIETTVYESKNIRLRINNELADSKFINFCFGAFGQQYFNYNAQQVVGMASINQNQIAQMPIPLPPLSEQKRIVAMIEELFTQLEAGMASLAKVQAGLRRYKASVLKAAVEGKLGIRNDEFRMGEDGLPEGWELVKLNDVTKKITDGTYFTPTYVESGVAFISVKDIYDGRVNFGNCKYIPQEEHDQLIKRCYPEPQDVLITKSGTIGRIAVVKTDRPFSLFVSVALIKPHPEFWESDFLAIVLENYINHLDIKQDVKGGVIKNLHIEDIKKIVLRLPPLEEQRRIVAEVERRLSVARQVESVVEKGMVRAGMLRQAELRSAFEGRLVYGRPLRASITAAPP